LRRNRRLIASLSERDRLRAEALVRAVAARLLENAESRVVQGAGVGEGTAVDVDTVRELFGLGEALGTTSRAGISTAGFNDRGLASSEASRCAS
jgi:Na+-transporting NADH:ubiquinone oxidoreductase subunit NqrD